MNALLLTQLGLIVAAVVLLVLARGHDRTARAGIPQEYALLHAAVAGSMKTLAVVANCAAAFVFFLYLKG